MTAAALKRTIKIKFHSRGEHDKRILFSFLFSNYYYYYYKVQDHVCGQKKTKQGTENVSKRRDYLKYFKEIRKKQGQKKFILRKPGTFFL